MKEKAFKTGGLFHVNRILRNGITTMINEQEDVAVAMCIMSWKNRRCTADLKLKITFEKKIKLAAMG